MSKDPFFSIVIPIYNGSRTILPVLNSILNQKCRAFELILYDDASTDNSVTIVTDWLKNNHGAAQFIQGRTNKGSHYAVTMCLAKSKGRYVVLGAQDNVFSIDRLEIVLVELKKNPDIGLITHDVAFGTPQQFNRNVGFHFKALASNLKLTLSNLLFFRSTLFQLDATIYQAKFLEQFSLLSNFSPIEDLALITSAAFGDKSRFLLHKHIDQPLIFQIKTNRSQSFIRCEEINNRLIAYITQQNINIFLRITIIWGSKIIVYARSPKTLGSSLRVLANPLFLLFGFLGLLLRFFAVKIRTSRYSCMDKFKSTIS